MWKDFFYFTKTERQGIIVLVVLVIGAYAIPRLLQAFSQPEKTNPAEQVKAEKEYSDFISSVKKLKPDKKYPDYTNNRSSAVHPKKEIRLASLSFPFIFRYDSVHQGHDSVCIPGHARVMGHQYDGLVKSSGKAHDHVHNFRCCFCIQISGRFICKHYLRSGHKCPGYSRSLLLAPGHLGGIRVKNKVDFWAHLYKGS